MTARSSLNLKRIDIM